MLVSARYTVDMFALVIGPWARISLHEPGALAVLAVRLAGLSEISSPLLFVQRSATQALLHVGRVLLLIGISERSILFAAEGKLFA